MDSQNAPAAAEDGKRTMSVTMKVTLDLEVDEAIDLDGLEQDELQDSLEDEARMHLEGLGFEVGYDRGNDANAYAYVETNNVSLADIVVSY